LLIPRGEQIAQALERKAAIKKAADRASAYDSWLVENTLEETGSITWRETRPAYESL